MIDEENSIPEEVVGLEYYFLPPDRMTRVDVALRALQGDLHLEFLLAVLRVTINDRPLSPTSRPTRGVLRKLLLALDEEDGEALIYESPYNDLGAGQRDADEDEERLTWWDFDLAEDLCEFSELRSVRIFLEFGSGTSTGRPANEAKALHEMLLQGLLGESRNYAIWGCADVRAPGQPWSPGKCGKAGGVWPAEKVSPWFRGVFWDDLLFVLNPAESTLTVFAVTSS
ncbi:MAG: hypothetical protein K0Q72_2040 [Armatimonadetes bacterium]|jgi:hypothetical protein|nr:hypothetical protein [Armatimonadota bacterium]